MKTRESLRKNLWLLAFAGLQVLALWRGFGAWLFHPARPDVQ